MARAKVAVLLISANFSASDFIADNELPRLLEAERERGLVILGLYINHSRFDRDRVLCEYLTINPPNRPIEGLSNAEQEEVFDDLAHRIEELLYSPNSPEAARHRPMGPVAADQPKAELDARYVTDVLPNGLAVAIAARQYALSKVKRYESKPHELPKPPPAALHRFNILSVLAWAAVCALGLALGLKLLGAILPALFGTTRDERSPNRKMSENRAYPVDCSVYAPEEVPIGQMVLVQVFLHPPELSDKAAVAALTFDTSAVPRGFTSLDLDLTEGARVGFELCASDLIVSDNGIGEIRWHNRVRGLQFQVTAPPDCLIGPRHATLRVFVQGAPAGRMHFLIQVVAEGAGRADPQPRGDAARRYRKAFISYASPDRIEVLKRVQLLDLLGIEYFQDFLALNPGERWQVALYREIDTCDLFLLFWSSAARDSEWVRKELLYALESRNSSPHGDPDILPVIIEGPPPVPPPPELKELHFNDKLIYLMRS